MFTAKLNEVLASKKSFFADPLNNRSILAASLLNIIHWGFLFSKITPNKGSILLHYNVIYGPELVQSSRYIYLIPLLALGILFLNIYISSMLYQKEKLASYFINFSSIGIQLIFFVASLVIIVANA